MKRHGVPSAPPDYRGHWLFFGSGLAPSVTLPDISCRLFAALARPGACRFMAFRWRLQAHLVRLMVLIEDDAPTVVTAHLLILCVVGAF